MEVPSINLGTGNIIGKDSEQAWAIRGAFMRFKYDYKGKYLFEMNGRYDGTSKFPHSSRFGFFPSLPVDGEYQKRILCPQPVIG